MAPKKKEENVGQCCEDVEQHQENVGNGHKR
jgi:hypothetical protein